MLYYCTGIPPDLDPSLFGDQAKPEAENNKKSATSPNSLFPSSCDSNSLMDQYGLAPLDVSLDAGGLFSLSPLASVNEASTSATAGASLEAGNTLSSWSSSMSKAPDGGSLLTVSTSMVTSGSNSVSSFSALGEDANLLSPDFMQELVGDNKMSEKTSHATRISQENHFTASVNSILQDISSPQTEPVITNENTANYVASSMLSVAVTQIGSSAVSSNSPMTKESTMVTNSGNLSVPIMTTGILNEQTSTLPNGMSYTPLGPIGPIGPQPGQSLGSLQGTLVLQANGQLLLLPSTPTPTIGNIETPLSSNNHMINEQRTHAEQSQVGPTGLVQPATFLNNQHSVLPMAAMHQPSHIPVQYGHPSGNRSVTVNTPQGLVTLNTMPSQPSQLPSALILPNGQIVPVVTQPNMVFGQNCMPVTGPLLVASNSAYASSSSATAAPVTVTCSTQVNSVSQEVKSNTVMSVSNNDFLSSMQSNVHPANVLPPTAIVSKLAVTAATPMPIIGQPAVMPVGSQQQIKVCATAPSLQQFTSQSSLITPISTVNMVPQSHARIAAPVAQAVLPPTLQAVMTPEGNIILTLPPAMSNVTKICPTPVKPASKNRHGNGNTQSRKSSGNSKMNCGPRVLMPKPATSNVINKPVASTVMVSGSVTANFSDNITPLTPSLGLRVSENHHVVYSTPVTVNTNCISTGMFATQPNVSSVATSTTDILARAAESIFSATSPSGLSSDVHDGFYNSLHDENALQIDTSVMEMEDVNNVQVHNNSLPEFQTKQKSKPKKKSSKKTNVNTAIDRNPTAYMSDSMSFQSSMSHLIMSDQVDNSSLMSIYMSKDDFADINEFSDLIKINDPDILAKARLPNVSAVKEEPPVTTINVQSNLNSNTSACVLDAESDLIISNDVASGHMSTNSDSVIMTTISSIVSTPTLNTVSAADQTYQCSSPLLSVCVDHSTELTTELSAVSDPLLEMSLPVSAISESSLPSIDTSTASIVNSIGMSTIVALSSTSPVKTCNVDINVLSLDNSLNMPTTQSHNIVSSEHSNDLVSSGELSSLCPPCVNDDVFSESIAPLEINSNCNCDNLDDDFSSPNQLYLSKGYASRTSVSFGKYRDEDKNSVPSNHTEVNNDIKFFDSIETSNNLLPCNVVGEETKNIAAETKNIAVEKSIAVETKSISSETQDVAAETKSIAAEIKSIAVETKSIADEIDNIIFQSAEVSVSNCVVDNHTVKVINVNEVSVQLGSPVKGKSKRKKKVSEENSIVNEPCNGEMSNSSKKSLTKRTSKRGKKEKSGCVPMLSVVINEQGEVNTKRIDCGLDVNVVNEVDNQNVSSEGDKLSTVKTPKGKGKKKKNDTNYSITSNADVTEERITLHIRSLADEKTIDKVETVSELKPKKEKKGKRSKAKKQESATDTKNNEIPLYDNNDISESILDSSIPDRIDFSADDLADVLDQVENLGSNKFSVVDKKQTKPSKSRKKQRKTESKLSSNNNDDMLAKSSQPVEILAPTISEPVVSAMTVKLTDNDVTLENVGKTKDTPKFEEIVELAEQIVEKEVKKKQSAKSEAKKELVKLEEKKEFAKVEEKKEFSTVEENNVTVSEEENVPVVLKETVVEKGCKKKGSKKRKHDAIKDKSFEISPNPVVPVKALSPLLVPQTSVDISKPDKSPNINVSSNLPVKSPVVLKVSKSLEPPAKKSKSKKIKTANFDVFDFETSENLDPLPAVHMRSSRVEKQRPASPIIEAVQIKKKSPKKKKKKKRAKSPEMPKLVVAEEIESSHVPSVDEEMLSDRENDDGIDHLHNLSLLSETCVAQCSETIGPQSLAETSSMHSPVREDSSMHMLIREDSPMPSPAKEDSPLHSSVREDSPVHSVAREDAKSDSENECKADEEIIVKRVAPMKVPRSLVIQPPSPLDDTNDRAEDSPDENTTDQMDEMELTKAEEEKVGIRQSFSPEPLYTPAPPIQDADNSISAILSPVPYESMFNAHSTFAGSTGDSDNAENIPVQKQINKSESVQQITKSIENDISQADVNSFYSCQQHLSSCSHDRSPISSNEQSVLNLHQIAESRDHGDSRSHSKSIECPSRTSSAPTVSVGNSHFTSNMVTERRSENDSYSRIRSPYSFYPPSSLSSEQLSSCQRGMSSVIGPPPLMFSSLEKGNIGWNAEALSSRLQYSPREDYSSNSKRQRHQSQSDQPSPHGTTPADYSNLHYASYGRFAGDMMPHYSERELSRSCYVSGKENPTQPVHSLAHHTPSTVAASRSTQASSYYSPSSLPSSVDSITSPPLHHYGSGIKDSRSDSCDKLSSYPSGPYGPSLSSYMSCDAARLLSTYSQLSSSDRYGDSILSHRSHARQEEESTKTSEIRKSSHPSSGHSNKVASSNNSSRRTTPHMSQEPSASSRSLDHNNSSLGNSHQQPSSKSSRTSSSSTKSTKKTSQPTAVPSRYDVEAFSRALYDQPPGMSAYYPFRPLTPPPRSLQSETASPFFAANFFAANSSRGLPGSSPLQHKAADITNPFMFPQSRTQHGGLGLNFQSSFGMGHMHTGHPSPQLAAQTAMASHFGFGNIFSEMNGCSQTDGLNLSPIKFPSQTPMDSSLLQHHQNSASLYSGRGQMPSTAMLQNAAAAMSLLGHPHSGFERSMPASAMPAHFASTAHPSFGMPLNFAMHDH